MALVKTKMMEERRLMEQLDLAEKAQAQKKSTQNKTLSFYKLRTVEQSEILKLLEAAVAAIRGAGITAELASLEFVGKMFEQQPVYELLVHLSRVNVFSKEFAEALKHDLDLLAVAKKLKYFTNLSLGQAGLLLNKLCIQLSGPVIGMQEQVDRLMQLTELGRVKVKHYMAGSQISTAAAFLQNDVELERIDPHSVYPTSIYRTCDGCTVATPDSQTIESVMRTDISTTIKITRGILNPSNRALADVYQQFGRVYAIIDDKVYRYYKENLEDYFGYHGIEFKCNVCAGNEANKDMENVQDMLIDMKKAGISRNEPVLVIGGGVIADLGGLATALYHRNTPYVMLCTSIVSGIDAGPSPRTCCDGCGFKNLYGSYHPPVLTLTDRFFWNTLHEGWIRHGIAEIIKMACVKDYSLFQLLEKAGSRLIRTKFGTSKESLKDAEFQDLCDSIVGKAMESYVRSEYGNLWETHQCRPHAFGHTWSPGYELPGGMLHGHAVASGMGYGAYLARRKEWISQEQFERILALISEMELTLWHPVMDNHELVRAANRKVIEKRGGNLCAPVPRNNIGTCGYINDFTNDDVTPTLEEYKAIAQQRVRDGNGIDMHCADVGLDDPSIVAAKAMKQIGESYETNSSDNGGSESGSSSKGTESNLTSSRSVSSASTQDEVEEKDQLQDASEEKSEMASEACAATTNYKVSYKEWIEEQQVKRNDSFWKKNVVDAVADTERPVDFEAFSLFQDGAEDYALRNTTTASANVRKAASITEKAELFMPCMVGAVESQFLKMQVQMKGAKRCLDIGTFTGMSALAMAEGGADVTTLECYEDTAKVAQQVFDASDVSSRIKLVVGKANESMQAMVKRGERFDFIFIDADKENYIEYFELSMQLLAEDGVILADNSLCALLYDQENDMRALKLHQFNQYVKNDERVEQVVLTIREGITLIRRCARPRQS